MITLYSKHIFKSIPYSRLSQWAFILLTFYNIRHKDMTTDDKRVTSSIMDTEFWILKLAVYHSIMTQILYICIYTYILEKVHSHHEDHKNFDSVIFAR